MDFAKHDTRSAAETAQPYHIRSQVDGDPINDGETPCMVMVIGAASRSVNAAIRAEQAAKMKAVKSAKTEADKVQAVEDLHETLCKAAARHVAGFRGVQRIDPETCALRDLTNTADDVKWFLDLNFISMPHLMRTATPLVQGADESADVFAERKAAHDAEWLKPSFAQQVLDAANEDARFLAGTSHA